MRESLALVIQSEKVLTQLEDHLDILRTFVRAPHDESEIDEEAER